MTEPIIQEYNNIRFSLQLSGSKWIFNAARISDGHRLPGQQLFTEDPSELMSYFMAKWIEEHPELHVEPEPTYCYACNVALTSDADTNYQFDNALWIGLFGAYGMFIDACDFPINTADQWLKDNTGEYLLDPAGKLIVDPNYRTEYQEKRILPGRPDKEVVICHRCAHELCEKVPWISKLIDPAKSHAHHYKEKDELIAQGHIGWDLQKKD